MSFKSFHCLLDFLKIIYTQNSSVNHKFKYLSITLALHTFCGRHKNIDRGQLENKVQFGRYQNFHAKSFLFFDDVEGVSGMF